jgi:hypothetical protein
MKIAVTTLALLVLATPAFATGSHSPPPAEPPATPAPQPVSADAASQAAAAARSKAAADAQAAAVAAQQQHASALSAAQGGAGGAGGVGNGEVSVGGDTSRYEAYALSLPGLVAAPAVPGQCLEHTAGWGAFSAGKTGATKLQALCMERVHCLALADRFASWGLVQAAADQLATCGGVAARIVLPPPPAAVQPPAPDLSQFVTREELNRAFIRSQSK